MASIMALAIPLLSPSPVHAALTPHAPIYIEGNDNFTAANGVVAGSGMAGDPYIIENWDISAKNANGIEIRNTTANFVIRNCYVHEGRNSYYDLSYYLGIYLYNVTNGIVDNNFLENTGIGIYLEYYSYNNLVKNNVARNNHEGIRYFYSHNNILENNIVENNFYYGILSKYCFYNIVKNNVAENNGNGIWFHVYSNNTIVENNIAENNSGNGIFFYGCLNNSIKNNVAENNGVGIQLLASVNNFIENNVAGNNDYGIWLSDSDNNFIENNIVENNLYSGIYLAPCQYDTYISYSDNNLVENNFVENNGVGIQLLDSDNNLISNNIVRSNFYYGIYLHHSYNNLIHHNNFLNNATQAYDNGSNYWDNGYSSGGNYWSDYASVDNYRGENQDMPGSDNIGDTPYFILGDNNRDRYPLMPWPLIRGVEVSIFPSYQSGLPGAQLTYTVTVTNIGNIADSYLIVINNSGWDPTLSENLLNVPAFENRKTILSVAIPENATPGTGDNITVIATSQTDNAVSDSATCIAHVPTWTGTATFKLENLYAVRLEKDLWLYIGSKLVVKFYDYDNSFENENVIHENFALPWHVFPENENVPHPENIGVKKAKLWLVDDLGNEISKIKGWVTIRDDLWDRLMEISAEWPYAMQEERDALWGELSCICTQWPYAPSIRDPIWVNP